VGPRVSLRRYYLRRLTRLEPPYLLALTLFFVLASAASLSGAAPMPVGKRSARSSHRLQGSYREPAGDGSARAGFRTDFEPSAQRGQAVGHALQAGPIAPSPRVEPHAIVGDLEGEVLAVPAKTDPGGGGVRALGHPVFERRSYPIMRDNVMLTLSAPKNCQTASPVTPSYRRVPPTIGTMCD
jgi:hypothetical protein